MYWLPNCDVRKRRKVTHFFWHSQFSPYLSFSRFWPLTKEPPCSELLEDLGMGMQKPLRKMLPWHSCLFHILYSTQAAGLLLPSFYSWAPVLGWGEEWNRPFQGAVHPPSFHHLPSRVIMPRERLFVLTWPARMHTSESQAATLVRTNLSVTSASLDIKHPHKCLHIYSSAWMLSTERALCVAGLGKAAASPQALFWRCTMLLMCQMAQYPALLSLTGASSATMLIFILPAAFYLRLVEKEPLRSPQKIGVRELPGTTKGRMGGCVLSTGHKYSALWLATPGSWSQIVVSHPKYRSGSEIQPSVESQASQAKDSRAQLLRIRNTV